MNEINKLNYSAMKQDFPSNTNKFLSFSFGSYLGATKQIKWVAKNSSDHVSRPTEKAWVKAGRKGSYTICDAKKETAKMCIKLYIKYACLLPGNSSFRSFTCALKK